MDTKIRQMFSEGEEHTSTISPWEEQKGTSDLKTVIWNVFA